MEGKKQFNKLEKRTLLPRKGVNYQKPITNILNGEIVEAVPFKKSGNTTRMPLSLLSAKKTPGPDGVSKHVGTK